MHWIGRRCPAVPGPFPAQTCKGGRSSENTSEEENMQLVSPPLAQILSLGLITTGIEQGKRKGGGESFTIFPALQILCITVMISCTTRFLIYVFQQQAEQK